MEEKKDTTVSIDDVFVADAKVIFSSVAIEKEQGKKAVENYQSDETADGDYVWRIRLLTDLDEKENGFIFERKALRLDKLTDVINELKTNGIIKENQANASKKAAEDMTSTSYGILVKVMYHPPRTLVAIRGDGKVTDADN